MSESLVPNSGRYKLNSAFKVIADASSEYLIKGIWPKEGIGCLYAPSGAGKSFMVMDMLGALSQNRGHWFGHRLHGSVPVTYLAFEGVAGVPRRLMAYERTHDELPGNFRVFDQSMDIRTAQDRLDFIDACVNAGQVGGVLVIDTLNQAAAGMDENSSVDMGLVISGAKELQAALGGFVLLISHTGKDVTRGIRGHSSLLAALDSAIELKREGDIRTWRVVKSKDGEDSASGSFRLRVVKLYEDEDGDAVTSCVVDPLDGTAPVASAKEMAAFEILCAMCKTAAPTMKEWREQCIVKNVISATSASAAEKALNRIKNSLLTVGLIRPSGMRTNVYLPLHGVSGDE